VSDDRKTGGGWPRRVGWGVAESWGDHPGGGRSWYGENVLDGLVEAIRTHVDAPRSRGQFPMLIGCCPWLTDDAVGEALTSLESCLVIGKSERSDRRVIRRLQQRGRPILKLILDGLDNVALPTTDGHAPPALRPLLISDEEWDLHMVSLGPVRVAGWGGRELRPLMHAKVVVMADAGDFPDGGPTGEEMYGSIPRAVWWGSANLTRASRRNIEFATFSTDPLLVQAAWRFVTDVIALSEPYSDVPMPTPRPQFVTAAEPPDPDTIDQAEEYDDYDE
jgi:hypothetical protein